MKDVLIIILLVVVFKGCADKSKKSENLKDNNQLNLSLNDRKEILKVILSSNRVAQFLHTNLPERNPLKILSNDQFNDKINLQIRDAEVIFVKENSKYKDAIKIEIVKQEDKIYKYNFFFYSKIEGANVMGEVFKNVSNIWNIRIISVIET